MRSIRTASTPSFRTGACASGCPCVKRPPRSWRAVMTWKDKLEIGLKGDAPFRRDNLPDSQKDPEGPETKPEDPTRSPEEPGAREAARIAHRIDKLRIEHAERESRKKPK